MNASFESDVHEYGRYFAARLIHSGGKVIVQTAHLRSSCTILWMQDKKHVFGKLYQKILTLHFYQQLKATNYWVANIVKTSYQTFSIDKTANASFFPSKMICMEDSCCMPYDQKNSVCPPKNKFVQRVSPEKKFVHGQ